jgi:hypothetical protein
VAEDIAAAVVGVVQQREVFLTTKSHAPLRLLVVFKLQEAADDLFFTSLLHDF